MGGEHDAPGDMVLGDCLLGDFLMFPIIAMRTAAWRVQTLAALYRLAKDKPGFKAFPRVELIAAIACLSMRTVHRHLDELERDGWIRRYGRENRRTCTFQLTKKTVEAFQGMKFKVLPRFLACEITSPASRLVLACVIGQQVLVNSIEEKSGFALESIGREAVSTEDIVRDTGLTRRAVEHARRDLVRRKLIEESMGYRRMEICLRTDHVVSADRIQRAADALPERHRSVAAIRTDGRVDDAKPLADSKNVASDQQANGQEPSGYSTHDDQYERMAEKGTNGWQRTPRTDGRGAYERMADAVVITKPKRTTPEKTSCQNTAAAAADGAASDGKASGGKPGKAAILTDENGDVPFKPEDIERAKGRLTAQQRLAPFTFSAEQLADIEGETLYFANKLGIDVVLDDALLLNRATAWTRADACMSIGMTTALLARIVDDAKANGAQRPMAYLRTSLSEKFTPATVAAWEKATPRLRTPKPIEDAKKARMLAELKATALKPVEAA
ncbi:MAG TPA: hypothetical protein VG713_12400 [Pirellulales bacterium]|nr:hypothetical protein [Pirellulales bacterium]